MTTVFYWNIDQANREEKYEETKWDKRSPGVKELIRRQDADIVQLVELRNLKTSNEGVNDFLHSLSDNYDYVYRKYCHYKDTFYMAILFKRDKFFVGDVRTKNYKQTPDNDKLVMAVDLQNIVTKKWVSVCLTHFGMSEEEKWQSTKALRQFMAQQPHPAFVSGDFNYFSDADGDEQRKYMENKMVDIAHPLYTEAGDILSGSFFGFSHDDHKKNWDNMSRLDHIFVPKDSKLKADKAISPDLHMYNMRNDIYPDKMYPSDHLGLKFSFELA